MGLAAWGCGVILVQSPRPGNRGRLSPLVQVGWANRREENRMRKSALIIHIGAIHLAATIGYAQDAPLAERAEGLPKPVKSQEERCCQEAEKAALADLAERFG